VKECLTVTVRALTPLFQRRDWITSGMLTGQPFHEPLRVTLLRTTTIALAVGGLLAWRFGRPRAWLLMSVLVFWFSFGGHWVDLLWRNGLRPRITAGPIVRIFARLAVWFVGGVCLGAGVIGTMRLFAATRAMPAPSLWMAGAVFVAVEIVAHAGLAVRQQPNFFTGAG
jgi:hypothetical protein